MSIAKYFVGRKRNSEAIAWWYQTKDLLLQSLMYSLLKYTLLCASRAFCVLLFALIPLACENPYAGEEGDDNTPTETVDDEDEEPSGNKTHPADSLPGGGSTEEEGNGEETDIVDGDGNTDYRKKIYTVDEFLRTPLGRRSVRVEGYIVGACSKSISQAEWSAPFTWTQAILLADRKGEHDGEKVMSVKLKSERMRQLFNLVAHPENHGRKVWVYGEKQTYLGIPGISDVNGYDWAE